MNYAISKLATIADAKNELNGGMMSSCCGDTIEEPQQRKRPIQNIMESINSTSAAVQVQVEKPSSVAA